MAYELVETITVGSGGAASIEFTSIPQDGVDLVCVFSLRAAGAGNQVFIRLNGSTSNDGVMLRAIDGVVSSISIAGDRVAWSPTSSYTANTFGSGQAYISNYASSADKSISVDSVAPNNSGSVYKMSIASQDFTSATGITSLKISISGDSIAEYGSASLYKIY